MTISGLARGWRVQVRSRAGALWLAAHRRGSFGEGHGIGLAGSGGGGTVIVPDWGSLGVSTVDTRPRWQDAMVSVYILAVVPA
jgi:hypothetical protein